MIHIPIREMREIFEWHVVVAFTIKSLMAESSRLKRNINNKHYLYYQAPHTIHNALYK